MGLEKLNLYFFNINLMFIFYLTDNIYKQMESGRMMFLHSVIIAILIFLFLFFVLKQDPQIAENRSILIGAIALIYMILFGHGLPTQINSI
jgi:hypothetical protein